MGGRASSNPPPALSQLRPRVLVAGADPRRRRRPVGRGNRGVCRRSPGAVAVCATDCIAAATEFNMARIVAPAPPPRTVTRTAPPVTITQPPPPPVAVSPPSPAPRVPTQPFGDLGLRTPMSKPLCNGQGIVVLGNATTPGRYAEEIQRLLNTYPGASYLRTDQSCPSLRQADDEGDPIYTVYRPAGTSQREVCAGVHAAGGGAYGKWMDYTTDPEYMIPC